MASIRPLRLLSRPVLAVTVLGLSGMIGCLDRPLAPNEPKSTHTYNDKLPQSKISKIDLVLMIDNSGSMADKQAILSDAVPDLVKGLVNPLCVDKKGVPAKAQPLGPLDKCPSDTAREFDPVLDIHIGIISSSLGGHGVPDDLPQGSGAGRQPHQQRQGPPALPHDPRDRRCRPTRTRASSPGIRRRSSLPPGETDIGDTYGAPRARPDAHGHGERRRARSAAATRPSSRAGIASSSTPSPTRRSPIQDGKAVPNGHRRRSAPRAARRFPPSRLAARDHHAHRRERLFDPRAAGSSICAAQQRGREGRQEVLLSPAPRRQSARWTPTTPAASPAASAQGECPVDPTCAPSPLDESRGPDQPPLLRSEAPLRHRLPLSDRSLHQRHQEPPWSRTGPGRWSRTPSSRARPPPTPTPARAPPR